MTPIQQALEDIREAERKCEELANKGTYTVSEMKELRTLLLKTVRNNLDCYLGHIPDKRHY